MGAHSNGWLPRGLSSMLLMFVMSHHFTHFTADGSDVIFSISDSSGQKSTLFKWAYSDSEVGQPEEFITLSGGTVITDVHCSFWGDNGEDNVFFTTHNEDSNDWEISKMEKSNDLSIQPVLNQNIGVFGISKLTYDAALNRLYFVNHFVDHWTLEMLDITKNKRIVLKRATANSHECDALHFQNGYIFWLQGDNKLHYANSDASAIKTEPILNEEAVDLSGSDDSIYIAYKNKVEKRQLQSDKWEQMGSIDISANVTSIYATHERLYVSREDGVIDLIDLTTWQKLSTPELISTSITFSGLCVDSGINEDPSGYSSVCRGDTNCDEVCFDVDQQKVCYCEHDSKKLDSPDDTCPEPQLYLAVSSGHSIEVLKGTQGNVDTEMEVDLKPQDSNSSHSVKSLSYSNKQDKIYAAFGKTVKTLKLSSQEIMDSVTLSDNILRVRIDDVEHRAYVAMESGHIEYYDLSLPKDQILASRHLVISRIYAKDFVVDYCYKNLYIASMNPVKIVKSSLEGGNFETIVDVFKVGHVTALALDRTPSRFLYLFDSGKNEIARVDLKSAAYDHEVIYKFGVELEVNSMDLRDNYLYFVNPVDNSVQRIDVTVPGSLLKMQDLPEGQTTHRLVALQDVTCPSVGLCQVYNGGCMDGCHIGTKNGQKTAVCDCTHENQHLVTTISGFCDWSNKTDWCSDYWGLNSDLSCDYGMRCLSSGQLCDGKNDCQDGSDENEGICAQRTCKNNEFKCHNGQCITASLECNHHFDCTDESDELYCSYKGQECADDEFQCPGNYKCIPKEKLCDHNDDCMNGLASDELFTEPSNCSQIDCDAVYSFWSIFFQMKPCNDTDICIPKLAVCDGNNDCGTNSDEQNCHLRDCGKDFKCDNGKCVSVDAWICDSYDDCGDFSDEKEELCENKNCSAGEFRCANGNCIPESYRCDSDNDCVDNSDEQLPLVDCENLECGLNQIRCNSTQRSRNRCIEPHEICDHKADCPDGEDEKGCSNRPVCNADTQFTCDNLLCISRAWYCDHDNDCGDGSDEPSNECKYVDCTPSEFRCNNGKCVPGYDRCDRMNDCLDQSDELDCNYEGKVTCDDDQVECPAQGSNQCIAKNKLCDGVKDCDHGSDEVNCGVNECEIESLNACEYKCVDEVSGYSCTCPPGKKVDEDSGHSCIDIDECSLYHKTCTHHCENSDGGYQCSCELGYIRENDESRNATICKHADDHPVYLLISDELSARLYNLRTRQTTYVENEGDLIVAADFDYKTEKVIYIDITKKHIASISKDGTDREVLIERDVIGGEGLAVDWVGRNFYWLDNERKSLEVATLDGKNRKMLTQKYLKQPRAIVVHPKRKMLFYSDWGHGNEHIGRMHMDGSNHEKIITTRVSWPNALTIDYATETLFYADAHLNVIESFDVNGENRKVIFSASDSGSAQVMSHVFAMTVFDEFMYWTDWNLRTVTRADNRNGGKVEVIYNSSKRPMDIHIWHRLRQSPIEVKNANGETLPTYEQSGCVMMLLTGNGDEGYVCACPNHFYLDTDGKTCVPNCPDGHKLCADSSTCYRSERYCDGHKDCPDESDEPDTCPANPCKPGSLHCIDSNKCVEHSEICDGTAQCRDGFSMDEKARQDETDEKDCHEFACPDLLYFQCNNHVCIKATDKCNGVNDCGDNSDENEEDCKNDECDPDLEFKCKAGNCIPRSWECDVDHDCPDGDDEPSDCAIRKSDCKESDGMFSCHTNYRCIPDYLRCNQQDDCRDNSDEKNCEAKECETGYFQCDDGLECIPERWKCDFNQNCKDGSDESDDNCADSYRDCDPEFEFRCDNEKCVSQRDVCDTFDDCGDNSDETRVDCGTLECHSDQFQCETSGHCIPDYKKCLDGTADCPDKSDEKNCGPRYPDGKYCLDEQFECDNKVCIPTNEVCNTFDDCGDGSDEKHSEDRCNHANCDDDNLYPCGSGECIYKFHICNDVTDCTDGSDESEELCAHSCQTDDNTMTCHNGYQCFTQSQACDGFKHCEDGTDELGCSATSCSDGNGGCQHYCNTTTENGSQKTFCSCRQGYEHDPDDAHKCIVKDYCKDWSTCSQECENIREDKECKCADNYKLSANRKVCKALGDPPVQLYVKEQKIMRLVSHPTYFLDTETVESAGDPKSMEFFTEPDNDLNLLFWLNARSKTIHRSIIPGVKVNGVVKQSDTIKFNKKRQPERAIAVDWVHNLLYFFEKDTQDKNRYNLVVSSVDGRYPRTLLHQKFEDPRDVVVDPINGWLFIADVTTGVGAGGKIYKYEGLGTALKTIVDDSIGDPHGLAIDFFKDSRLYWSDFSERAIFSVKHDGTDRKYLDLTDLSGDPKFIELKLKPSALFVFEHEIFFYAEETNLEDSPVSTGIYKHSKFIGGPATPSVVKDDTQSNAPFILFHAYARPVGSNRCHANDCSHLCLPVFQAGNSTARVCACPDGSKGSASNPTCSSAPEEYRAFQPCNGRGSVDTNLQCVCDDGFKGDFCQKEIKRGRPILIAFLSLFAIVCVILLVVLFAPIPHKDKIKAKLFGIRGTDPVSFHVGNARANPGFDTHDNDRVTLGRDFPGYVDEDAMKSGVPPSQMDFGFVAPGGNSVAFSNPVFDIQQAQTAIHDFQPPSQALTAISEKPSTSDGNFPSDAVMSSSDVKVDLNADMENNKL